MRSSANDEGLVEKIIMQHGGSKGMRKLDDTENTEFVEIFM